MASQYVTLVLPLISRNGFQTSKKKNESLYSYIANLSVKVIENIDWCVIRHTYKILIHLLECFISLFRKDSFDPATPTMRNIKEGCVTLHTLHIKSPWKKMNEQTSYSSAFISSLCRSSLPPSRSWNRVSHTKSFSWS